MKQQVVIFNGITYDYFEDIEFYTMLGLLDSETGMFEGVEISTDTLKELGDAKKQLEILDPISAKVVTGFVEDEIHYYAVSMVSGKVSYTKLKPVGEASFYGKVQAEELLTGKSDSRFKTAMPLQYIKDESLEAQLIRLLGPQKNMFVWSKIQESIQTKRTSEKVKVLEA